MAKKDYNQDEGVKETDKVLAQNEKEIAKVYKQAEEEIQAKLDKYLADFKRKDEKKREQLASGEITKDEYDKWRVGQIAIGQRWEEMKQTIAEDYANAAGIAKSVTYGHMPEVYAINHNYGTFQVEKGSNINTSYTMYNKDTVENLFKDGTFYPSPGKKVTKEINEGKQTAWDKKQVQSAMLQGILQGESVDKIAKRVANTVGEKDKKAAIRNARTMTTCVQNKGRLDSYKRAETMGIEVMNEWIACLDDRTRHEHRLLDGQKVKIGEKFKVDGEEIEYPGDPSASGFMVYNCRCCLSPFIKGISKGTDYSTDLSDRYSKLGDMTYDEWKNGHKAQDNNVADATTKMYNGTKKTDEMETVERPKLASGEATDLTVKYVNEKIEEKNIEYNKPEPLETSLTEKEIITKVGELDPTEGSCTSVAFAYVANKIGLDVTDFRGGDSTELFADPETIKRISLFPNVDGDMKTRNNDFVAVKELLKETKRNKEYLLSTAGHTAVIRKKGFGYEYLELQLTEEENTWTPLNRESLTSRFGCVENNNIDGVPIKCTSVLIETSSLGKSEDFLELLGYINTKKVE